MPEEILYDRMKTAVIGEERGRGGDLQRRAGCALNHYGAVPRACQPYRAKTKGKVERPFRYIRQDFFLARTFRNIDDLNAQFASGAPRWPILAVHATTRRVVDTAFAEEQPEPQAAPGDPLQRRADGRAPREQGGDDLGRRELLFRARYHPAPEA